MKNNKYGFRTWIRSLALLMGTCLIILSASACTAGKTGSEDVSGKAAASMAPSTEPADTKASGNGSGSAPANTAEPGNDSKSTPDNAPASGDTEMPLKTTDGDYTAFKASEAPVIDGIGDEECWQKAEWMPIDKVWGVMVPRIAPQTEDFSGRCKITWTEDNLFLLAEITDDKLVDTHEHPVDNYWNDDCLECFIDEDFSGGAHTYSFNAFAYHMSIDYTVADFTPESASKGAALFNDHINYKIVKSGDSTYIWEAAIKIYPDTYDMNSTDNKTIKLEAGKVMGFALAYCDSDSTKRDHFVGTVSMPEGLDLGYQNADSFGVLQLK